MAPWSVGRLIVLTILVIFSASAFGRRVKDGKETWAYVNVRPDAYMFWWLYYSTTSGSYLEQPLVVWLQGGPGGSSTGFGNFMEIGPLNVNLTARNETWLGNANLLFVDNPVGTGFSYVTNKSALATNNAQIGDDLVTFIQAFLTKLPEFQKVPLYIFSESYGGKMAVAFARALNKAIEAQKIKCSFKGVALGDSWISPIDSVSTWGPYLYSTSLVDEVGLKAINSAAANIQEAIAKGDYKTATQLWNEAENVVEKVTNNVNFYNILTKDTTALTNKLPVIEDKKLSTIYMRHVLRLYTDELDKLMNGKVKEKLRTIPENVTWGGQSADVFSALSTDFMVSVANDVEYLLNSTMLSVVVYNGQLDLIVDSLGTFAWIQKLKWLGMKPFNESVRSPVPIRGDGTAAFVKSFKNFAFYWILKAGHMVPADAGQTGLKMLTMITKGGNKP